MTSDTNLNLAALHRELDWLDQVISQTVRSYFKQEGHEASWQDIPLPELSDENDIYGRTVCEWELGVYERLALALTLAPHLRPEMLDIFFSSNEMFNRGYTEFGGIVDNNFSGFIPTGQTLLFIVSGGDPMERLEAATVLSPSGILMREQVLELKPMATPLPVLGGMLGMSDPWLQYFLTGEQVRPERSSAFPAHLIATPLDWDDLVLEYQVMEQVEEIRSWLEHGNTLMTDWGLDRTIKAGYRALFFGPAGTGKTLTASLLGKSTDRDVYRVDLSMIVSKYIGETEKNLSRVFDAAAYKDWILFFDEADSLFGKRTNAVTSNDRHSNQQTGYLLQRIEDFPGVVILASNLKSNMDEAFTRRFQSMIHFTMPPAEERLRLWQNAFSGVCQLHQEVDLEELAENYELAGGAIINVLRTAALSAATRGDALVRHDELMTGLRREYKKENRTITVN